MVIASIIITSSALVAIQGDLQNGTVAGYVFLMGANLGTVLYAEISGKLQNKNKKDSIELLQCNTMNSIIPIFIMALCQDEVSTSIDNFIKSQQQVQIVICLFLMSFMIFGHQLFLYLASKYTSPFAIGLSGNFKDVFATVVSLLFFTDVNLSNQVKLSLLLSFLGSFGFCISKYLEAVKKSKEEEEEKQDYQNIKNQNDTEMIDQQEMQVHVLIGDSPEVSSDKIKL